MNEEKFLLKEMTHYWGQLNEEQQKAVLGMVKTFVKVEARWDDKEYIAEMDKRFTEMKNGKGKGLDLNQLEEGARQAYKVRKHKKQ